MINISNSLKSLLETRSCEVIVVAEIYTRDTIDISSISAPSKAIARFSDKCFTWQNSSGSYEYDAKILEFPSIKTFMDGNINEAEIVISNTKRGTDSGVRFIIDNKIKGCWLVIRLIFPNLPDEDWVLWWGKCLRPGKIDSKNISISATQEVGNFKVKIPFRSYQLLCPETPGKGDCLGNETLEQKSILYQEMYNKYGTMLCPDRKYTTCVKLGNDKMFKGQTAPQTTGSFSYVPKEDSSSQAQSKLKKKNVPALKTESWSSMNQSESGSDVINLAFGRSQLAGHPFTWADQGGSIISLQGFCEGRISDFDFIKCRNTDLTLTGVVKHYGDYGGSGSQTPDTLFGGLSGYNSRLAYLEVTVSGSQPENVDNAPLITAVIRGMQIPVPDVNGQYTLSETTDNPVHIIRFLFTDQKYGKVPTYRMADDINLITADVCNELIEDRTQCENIVLPDNEYLNYGESFRRYRSTSIYNAYTDMYSTGKLNDDHPDLQEPWVKWYRPFNQPPVLPDQTVLRRRFTINGAIQEKSSLLDVITKRMLPCFRGWLNYNKDGKIEIRTRTPADTTYLRANIPTDSNLVSVNNIKKWRGNLNGYLLIGAGTNFAEIRKVTGIMFSPAANNLPITVETTGGLTASTTPITNGSFTSQGYGYIDIGGNVLSNDTITIKFNSPPDQHYITYNTDGMEDLGTVARMVTAHLNANPDFSGYLSAYIIPTKPNRVYIRCEAGFLKLDKNTEYEHLLGEEVMRVQMVFENCNDIYSDASASFDNILVDSFSWNENQSDSDINSYTSLYTSAIDDFHVAKIIPRTSWDTVNQEGELNEEELDLKLVDNYWQAAYVTKTYAIENIDGDLLFTWRTGINGFRLEMGDVVAVRHDSGDGALRYIPVWIKSASYNLKDLTTDVQGKLYLSGAWDERIQSIDPFLTTTLNPNFPPFTPEAIGSSGGFAEVSKPRLKDYVSYPWIHDSRYSPSGDDLI